MKDSKVFVINLKRSVDRNEYISNQFKQLNLKFEIFEAIDGINNNHYLLKKYNDVERFRIKGKSLRRSQLGCYASHYLLWEKCVTMNQPIIILENDALIDFDNFVKFYNLVKANDLNNYECIRLFQNQHKKHRYIEVEKKNGLSIIKYLKGSIGAVGYYLTPAGAKKFLNDSTEWILTVDVFMDRFWSHNVECYGVLPKCLGHSRALLGTTLDDKSENVKRTLKVKIMRELFSLKELIKRTNHNIKFIAKNILSSSNY